jgi:flagellar hook-associated protein 2
MSSPLSFQGLSTGLQTDSIVNAILQQEGQPVQRMLAQQAKNTQRIGAFQAMQSNLTALSSSLSTLSGTSFATQTVTSSDATNTYVTATATGATVGNYSLNVSQIATAGRISPTLSGGAPTNLSVADPLATTIFTGSSASFAVQGTDGVIKTLTLGSGSNNLYGLRDAINASGASVQASVINTGSGTNPYQLVVTASGTGTGTTNGAVTLADITSGAPVNTLGITAGTVDNVTTPTTLSGGLQSATADIAKNAVFSVNGIQLTRQTNVVSDAVSGVTFTLKQGGQTGTTNLAVATDTSTITSAMQDVVSKYNSLVTAFSSASASGGALYGDSVARSLVSQVRTALTGVPSGLPLTSTYTSAGGVGVKVNQDGTLSLDTTAFQAALAKDPAAVKNVFAFSGTSSSAAVQFYGAGANTTTGNVGFNITSYVPNGAVSGTFTVNGTNYTLNGNSGTLVGAAGTPLEGLILTASGTGSGNITLSRGVGQAVQDLVTSMTASVSGQLPQIIQSVNDQNSSLAQQISSGQARLAQRKLALQAQFAQMEAVVGQLQSAGSSLTGM